MSTHETAIARTKRFLRDLLGPGPMRSTEIQQRVTDEGLSWRTAERAAKALGIQSAKSGSEWFWLLPEAQHVDHSRQSAPPQKPKRRTTWVVKQQSQWSGGNFSPVRCAHCAHAYEIEDHGDHGWCEQGQTRITFIYANRRCDQFEAE